MNEREIGGCRLGQGGVQAAGTAWLADNEKKRWAFDSPRMVVKGNLR
jgi:hypothetical protein